MNYEAIPWLVDTIGKGTFPFEYVIYDELSKMKDPASQRFKKLKSVLPQIRYRCGGTGTPVGAHLKDLYGEMFVCDKGRSLGKVYDSFLGELFSYNDYSKQYTPYDFAEKRILNRIKKHAISFDIDDLNLPPISHYPIPLEMPEHVRDVYAQMRDTNVIEEIKHEDGDVDNVDIAAVNAAVKSGKLRQLASGIIRDNNREHVYLHNVKAEYLKNLIDELQGQRVMIFFEYVSDYLNICETLKKTVPVIYGGTKVREVNSIERKWNAGKLPFLALHPRSAAYGLNLQDSANVIVFYTIPWSQELITQSIGRLWRQGQKNKVLVYYFLIGGTVDEAVYERIQDRQGLHDRVMKALL
jgi:SNF2 family DNA or RNA helicase